MPATIYCCTCVASIVIAQGSSSAGTGGGNMTSSLASPTPRPVRRPCVCSGDSQMAGPLVTLRVLHCEAGEGEEEGGGRRKKGERKGGREEEKGAGGEEGWERRRPPQLQTRLEWPSCVRLRRLRWHMKGLEERNASMQELEPNPAATRLPRRQKCTAALSCHPTLKGAQGTHCPGVAKPHPLSFLATLQFCLGETGM